LSSSGKNKVVTKENTPRPGTALAKKRETGRTRADGFMLGQSLEEFRMVFESASDIILLIDNRGKILDVNEKIKEIGGYEKDELLGKNIRSLTKILTKKSLPVVIRNFVKRMLGINVKPYQVEMVKKNGELATIEINAVAIKKNGKIAGDLAVLRDVTEHKRAEEELKLKAQILDSATDSIFLHDTAGNFFYVNESACQVYGYSKEEFMKLNLRQVQTPAQARDFDLVTQLVGRKLSDRNQAIFEAEHLRKDGSVMPVEIHGRDIKSGARKLLLAVIRDITERKQAEEIVRDKEERLRLTFESAGEGILVMDLDNTILDVNQALVRMHGYDSREELIGRSALDLSSEEDRDRARSNTRKRLEQGLRGTIEYNLIKKDGSRFPAEVNTATIRDAQGNPIGFIGIFNDITERKQAEEKVKHAAQEWRTTFDSISDTVFITNRDLVINRANRTCTEVSKVRFQDLFEKTCSEVLQCSQKDSTNCPHQKTLRTKKPANVDFFVPGLGVYLQESTSPIFDETGEVIGVVHIARDVTQYKQMEQQLIMTDRLASIGELVSGIAHELNNPLTSVIGFSELLKEADIPQEIKEDLDTISSEAGRAANIVRNLLTFARKHDPVRQQSQINSIIDDVLKLRAYEHKVNNISILKDLAKDLPEIMVDYFQIQQVFLNIVVNAEQAMLEAHKGGTLLITTSRLENIIRVAFTDDGPGIPEKDVNKIFNPFFTTKEVGKGTGLGLSICHGVVSAHSGQTYVQSKPGKGATFTIELPIDV
jgi:PAS domain S-box-containing protein